MSQEKVERFAKLVAGEPDNPLHNFALARAHVQAEDFESGERAFTRCLELKPDWMVAAIQRGRCLIGLGRWEDARAALELGARLAEQQSHDEPFEEIRELMDQIPD